MPELPPHPVDDRDDIGESKIAAPRSRRILWWVAGIALVTLFVVLHLTGVVGAGSH